MPFYGILLPKIPQLLSCWSGYLLQSHSVAGRRRVLHLYALRLLLCLSCHSNIFGLLVVLELKVENSTSLTSNRLLLLWAHGPSYFFFLMQINLCILLPKIPQLLSCWSGYLLQSHSVAGWRRVLHLYALRLLLCLSRHSLSFWTLRHY